MRHTAQLRFELGDEATAEAVRQALMPEMADGPEGTAVTLRREGATLHADVRAADLAGLRAGLNGVVRLLDAAAKVAAPAEST